MQEVMQYEASYGSEFWIVIAVCAVIYVYTNLSFISNGHRLHVKHNGDIYKAYCGKYIGKFFDYFSALFCYMSFVVMCGGANSTAMEQWGLPNGVGAAILAALVIVTASFTHLWLESNCQDIGYLRSYYCSTHYLCCYLDSY